jgi:hypothetical protein
MKKMLPNGRIANQVIGVNTIAEYPKKIATYLQLPYCNEFTSHAFRRSAATIYADSGASISQLKGGGGWKSSSAAELYVNESMTSKMHVASAFSTTYSVHTKRTDSGEDTSSSYHYDEKAMHFEVKNSPNVVINVVFNDDRKKYVQSDEEKKTSSIHEKVVFSNESSSSSPGKFRI